MTYWEVPQNDWIFHAGDFSLNNAPCLDRLVYSVSNHIKALFENNQCCTIQEIADILEICIWSIEKSAAPIYFAYVSCFHVWLPHKEKTLLNCVSCYFFLHNMMGNGKWILYNSMKWILGQMKSFINLW